MSEQWRSSRLEYLLDRNGRPAAEPEDGPVHEHVPDETDDPASLAAAVRERRGY